MISKCKIKERLQNMIVARKSLYRFSLWPSWLASI